jgi:transcriptional regulator with XRE-family HTH domain
MPEQEEHPSTQPADSEADDGGLPPLPAGLADERFATNIREIRQRKKMSQGELARRMAEQGYPYYQQTVRRIEDGTRKVSVGEAVALGQILSSTVDRLTWPGREASAAGLLDMTMGRLNEAWSQIERGTAAMLWNLGQLQGVVASVEKDDYLGSATIRNLVKEAKEFLKWTPEAALEGGYAEHEALPDGGEEPEEEGDEG